MAPILLLLGACSSGTDHIRSDWEIENAARLAKEDDAAARPVLPRYPRDQDLVEVRVPRAADFRFSVDAATLGVERGIVRYVLVARSSSGAQNVTFEGINCRTRESRLYATGHAGGEWRVQDTPWRETAGRVAQRVLITDYFCPGRQPIASAAEGAAALRGGGHPNAALSGR